MLYTFECSIKVFMCNDLFNNTFTINAVHVLDTFQSTFSTNKSDLQVHLAQVKILNFMAYRIQENIRGNLCVFRGFIVNRKSFTHICLVLVNPIVLLESIPIGYGTSANVLPRIEGSSYNRKSFLPQMFSRIWYHNIKNQCILKEQSSILLIYILL